MIKQDNRLIELTGLELAKYIMLKLVDNRESIEQLSENFDNDVRFINRVIDFLKDIKWIEEVHSSSYQMTDTAGLKVRATKIFV